MRRQALVPLAEHFRTRRIREARLLDIACGTGRFLTFVKDNYPRLAVTGLDLSPRSEEHTSELQSLMRISYAVFCLKKKKQHAHTDTTTTSKKDEKTRNRETKT